MTIWVLGMTALAYIKVLWFFRSVLKLIGCKGGTVGLVICAMASITIRIVLRSTATTNPLGFTRGKGKF
jgi:hypothetical protein